MRAAPLPLRHAVRFHVAVNSPARKRPVSVVKTGLLYLLNSVLFLG